MKNLKEQARQYLAKQPGAVTGQSGDRKTFLVAVALRRKFQLTVEVSLEVIQEWNQRCIPPWAEHELLHKLRSAAACPSLNRSGLPDEVTASKGIRLTASRRKKSVFRPMVLKRITAKTGSISDIQAFLKNASPVGVEGVDSASVLRLLYPPGTGEKVLIFSEMKSQGQLLYQADEGETIQSSDLPAGPDGVWYLPQPVSGLYLPNPRNGDKVSRRSEEAVTAWRYAVLESDEAEPEDWLRCLVQLPLRIASVCESGGRSIHALIRIDATSKSDWDTKIAPVKPLLITLGADPIALTAIRLTRLPQAKRGERIQRLLYLDPVPDSKPIIDKVGNIQKLK